MESQGPVLMAQQHSAVSTAHIYTCDLGVGGDGVVDIGLTLLGENISIFGVAAEDIAVVLGIHIPVGDEDVLSEGLQVHQLRLADVIQDSCRVLLRGQQQVSGKVQVDDGSAVSGWGQGREGEVDFLPEWVTGSHIPLLLEHCYFPTDSSHSNVC
jgi:hypothetical protein